ncbi:peptidase M22, glycoprotease [Phellopilus nigrolimitatus]|nr:peptidase M22, glycoprotease [Phellopilus nigrolimitatus]
MLSASRRCLPRQLPRANLLHRRCPGRAFTVLALESSADDTCAAIVTSEREILANVVLRQLEHEAFGGIRPYTALREHQRNMPVAVRSALDEAKLDMSAIDGIAFTRGPGMAGCLAVCTNAAKTLASALHKPLIGVHHMQAHALTPLLISRTPATMPTFPFLTLLISGGHTLLLLALSVRRFRILATTRDEAIGRTVDKVARALRLEWRGRAPGAALEAFCAEGIPGDKGGELPYIAPLETALRERLSFSFSGLHSAVDRYVQTHGSTAPPSGGDLGDSETPPEHSQEARYHSTPHLSDAHRLAIARAFQACAAAQLEEKVVLALHWCKRNRASILADSGRENDDAPPDPRDVVVKHVVVSGGVASNMYFRERLSSCLKTTFPNQDLSLVFPPPALCTDNAAMIAWASMHRFLAGEADDSSILTRRNWSIEELDA